MLVIEMVLLAWFYVYEDAIAICLTILKLYSKVFYSFIPTFLKKIF